MPKKQPLIIKAPDRPPSEPSTRPIYELSTTTIDATPTSVTLPPEADTLSEAVRELAVRFIGARRRIGEALLEACRYMSEARTKAAEGEWYTFLTVTGTSPDSAATLINIHYRAAQHPAFAEKIRSGWLNQTVAGELAKPSTPPELLQQMLELRKPPRVADIKQARRPVRETYHQHVDNPNYAGWEGGTPLLAAGHEPTAAPQPIEATRVLAHLHDVATTLETLAHQPSRLPHNEQTHAALQRIELALNLIQHSMGSRERDFWRALPSTPPSGD